eukprot:TRINITY_DN331_c0_g1_i1.p1 TRINITY_DN331_c0_g1~~TRINITY_DN331_c0_g1_i1.p1  ORF type:complete len:614 (+),score=170.12 TRINITY_DN331_c0_g1_i1:222-2063(+)
MLSLVWRGNTFAIIAALLWGMGFIPQTHAVKYVPVFYIVCSRCSVAATFMGIIILIYDNLVLFRTHRKRLLLQQQTQKRKQQQQQQEPEEKKHDSNDNNNNAKDNSATAAANEHVIINTAWTTSGEEKQKQQQQKKKKEKCETEHWTDWIYCFVSVFFDPIEENDNSNTTATPPREKTTEKEEEKKVDKIVIVTEKEEEKEKEKDSNKEKNETEKTAENQKEEGKVKEEEEEAKTSASITSPQSQVQAQTQTQPQAQSQAQQRQRAERWHGLKLIAGGSLCGLFLATGTILQQWGLQTVSAGIAAFITGSYSVLVPIFRLIIFREVPRFVHVISIMFAVAGMFLLSITDDDSIDLSFGNLIVLLGAIAWALHVIACDFVVDHSDAFRLTCIQSAFTALAGLAGLLIGELGGLTSDHLTVEGATKGTVVWSILYLAILSSVLAYALQFVAQRYSPPTHASILFALEAPFSAIFGFLILDERMSWKQGLGCGIIMLGALIATLSGISKGENNKTPSSSSPSLSSSSSSFCGGFRLCCGACSSSNTTKPSQPTPQPPLPLLPSPTLSFNMHTVENNRLCSSVSPSASVSCSSDQAGGAEMVSILPAPEPHLPGTVA